MTPAETTDSHATQSDADLEAEFIADA